MFVTEKYRYLNLLKLNVKIENYKIGTLLIFGYLL